VERKDGKLPRTPDRKVVKKMTRHSGGETVGAGTYWNLKSGKVVELKTEGILPGGGELGYYRVPFFILFFLMIALGGVYVLFLPVLIISTMAYMTAVRVFGSLYLQMRKSMSFGWRPAEAYLAGKGKEKEKDKEKETETGKEGK
jgi:hypothetical protein